MHKFECTLLGCMEHSAWLQDNCRVCGGRVTKSKVSYDCHTESNQLKLQAIGISVSKDKKDVHPQRFCHSCYNVCTCAIKASADGKDYTHNVQKFKWVEHTDTDCLVCRHFGESQEGENQNGLLWEDLLRNW